MPMTTWKKAGKGWWNVRICYINPQCCPLCIQTIVSYKSIRLRHIIKESLQLTLYVYKNIIEVSEIKGYELFLDEVIQGNGRIFQSK